MKSAVFKLVVYSFLFLSAGIFRVGAASTEELKKGEFSVEIKDKQLVDLYAKGAKLSEILQDISRKTGIKIQIQGSESNRVVTLSFKNEPLPEALKRIIYANYVLVFTKTSNEIRLEEGNVFQANDSSSNIPEFSGTVVIDGKVAKMFYTPPGRTQEEELDYIQERHRLLGELSDKYPNKVIEAQISFENFISANVLLVLAANYDINVKTLSPGWKDHVGGFEIRSGQKLQEAVKKLADLERNLVDTMYESEKNAVLENTNSDAFKANSKFLQELEERKKSLKENGVMFYGMKVEGKASEIKTIRDESEAVKLVDPVWGGGVEESIRKTYFLQSIPIPILPPR